MIEAHGLTKRYGGKVAVDGLTFTVRPGVVTGFLGPNGAGKSTTIRMILGLDAPTAGSATVNGRVYAGHATPLHEVGALLDARAAHTGRSARNHLLALAATTGISRRRVDLVVGLVGLGEVARKRAGGFSLGMGQRLGIAAALLGDPATLILDEPVNGLDPEGILWIRNLLKALAADGRTVFVSSHLMSEMALTAEQLIIVGRGRLIADVSVTELTRGSRPSVRVRSPQATALRDVLTGPEMTVTTAEAGVLDIEGLDSEAVGRAAHENGILFVTFLAGQAILSAKHAGASLSDPGVLRAVAVAGLYLTVVGLLAMALGFLVRNTAGAMAMLFSIVLVLPVLADVLPSDWAARVVPCLPSNAGQAVMQLHPAVNTMAPWTGFALFAGYTAVAIAMAAVVLKRRDA